MKKKLVFGLVQTKINSFTLNTFWSFWINEVFQVLSLYWERMRPQADWSFLSFFPQWYNLWSCSLAELIIVFHLERSPGRCRPFSGRSGSGEPARSFCSSIWISDKTEILFNWGITASSPSPWLWLYSHRYSYIEPRRGGIYNFD